MIDRFSREKNPPESIVLVVGGAGALAREISGME
jgi:hypothetical protein